MPEGSVILKCPWMPWYAPSINKLFLHHLLVALQLWASICTDLWKLILEGIYKQMTYAVSVSLLFCECFNYENLVLNCTSQCKSSRIWTLKQEIWANRTLSYNHKDHSVYWLHEWVAVTPACYAVSCNVAMFPAQENFLDYRVNLHKGHQIICKTWSWDGSIKQILFYELQKSFTICASPDIIRVIKSRIR